MSPGRKKSRRSALLPLLLGVLLGAVAVLSLSPELPRGLRSWVERLHPAPAPPQPTPAPAPTPRVAAKSAPAPADFEAVSPANPAGVLAIVLDDMGYDTAPLHALEALPGPIGLAVIPSAPHARDAAALAKKRGWDLLVHLPMAPEAGAHESDAVGPSDDDAAIAARVGRALEKVPGAIGLNNHQGSQATADARVVRAVLGVVRDRGLFFLDSRTTAASVAEREARALGVSTIGRDVFLDDAPTEAADPGGADAALGRAWEKALATARKRGHCVVIGHPHPATLAFLAARLRGTGAPHLVKVSELVD